MTTTSMISIPVAVHIDLFKWQLDLFWFNHQLTYEDAKARAKAIIIKRNQTDEPKYEFMQWPLSIPHAMCEGTFDYPILKDHAQPLGGIALPLNIQIGLAQILDSFHDEQVLELNDCDMFHFKKHPPISIGDDELYVSDIYEEWHLKSLTDHKNVIECYFENQGQYYNGGFVPIIGKARTFKKILSEWIAIHVDILKQDWPNDIKWWAGMYALQAACEKAKVTMIAKDYCYIPGINALSPDHYICHYSIDKKFDKKNFPNVNIHSFEDNLYYDRVRQWLSISSYATDASSQPAVSSANVAPKSYFEQTALNDLGVANVTDKSSLSHDYLKCYDFFMSKYRSQKFAFMELGVGRMETQGTIGASLKTWRDYFPLATVIGVDIYESCKAAEGPRIHVEIGDSSDVSFLHGLQAKYQPLIIVDDASHRWSHQVIAFESLFPALPQGGIYICEDIHTSFLPLAEDGYRDADLDPYTYFSRLSSLVAGAGTESPTGINTVATDFQKRIYASISSITIRRHTVIITK